ncbi:MAG: IS1634 family transposase [bacterium]|nr:IS1634 family transposase [bacterium]
MAYIVKQGIRGKIYVYIAESKHISAKKQSRQKREYLGVFDEGTNELILGKNSPEPDRRISELLKKAGIGFGGAKRSQRGRGRRGKKRQRSSIAASSISEELDRMRPVESVGEVHVLQHIAASIGLSDVLLEAFDPDVAKALLVLAMHQVCEGKALYLAEDWIEGVRLDPQLRKYDFSSPALSGLMMQIGEDESLQQAFVRAWINKRGKPHAVVHDITSLSTYSENLDLAELGYNRDGEFLRQINLALVVCAETGYPLAVRLIQGSVPDVKTLKNTGEFLKGHGLNNVKYSLDRGFYSNANTRDMLIQKLGFTMGVPKSCNQTLSLIKRHRQALNSCKRSFQCKGGIMRHVADVWTVHMGSKEKDRRIGAHVYFDPVRATRQADQLEREVFAIEEKAKDEQFSSTEEADTWIAEHGGLRAKCLKSCTDEQGKVGVGCKPRGIASIANRLGYTVLITDDRTSKGPIVLTDYRRRDRAEKLFDILKNEIEHGRLRTGVPAVARGRVFFALLCLILYSGLESAMLAADLFRSWTIPKVIAELRKIKIVNFSSGDCLLTEISKRQRQLLKDLRVSEPTLS